MKTKDYIRVQLKIHDFLCTVDEISNMLDLQPTNSWKKGEIISDLSQRQYKQNGWSLSSSLSNELDVQLHIKNLFKLIEKKIENFNKLPSESYVELSIYIEKYSEGAALPAIFLDRDDIETLYKIRANVDVDIYALNET